MPDVDWAQSVATAAVCNMNTIGQLQAALDLARTSRQLVVMKFTQEACGPCFRMRKPFEDAIKEHADAALFFNVDLDSPTAIKQLGKRAGLRKLPSTHIYKDGKLQAAVGAKEFRATLDELCRQQRQGPRWRRWLRFR